MKRAIARITDAVGSGAMPPPLTTHYPLTRWEDAIDAVMSRRAIGKVILDVAQ